MGIALSPGDVVKSAIVIDVVVICIPEPVGQEGLAWWQVSLGGVGWQFYDGTKVEERTALDCKAAEEKGCCAEEDCERKLVSSERQTYGGLGYGVPTAVEIKMEAWD